jgi:hypothetical protein
MKKNFNAEMISVIELEKFFTLNIQGLKKFIFFYPYVSRIKMRHDIKVMKY